MFERFTDQARRVVVFAQEECRLLEHDHIGTEHLVLGLLHDADREDDDGSGQALAAAGATLTAARRRLQETSAVGPRVAGHIPFSRRARKVYEGALRAAGIWGQQPIDRRHLLVGVLGLRDGTGVRLLADLGVDIDALAAAAGRLVANAARPRPPLNRRLHPQARRYLAAQPDPAADVEGLRRLTSETSRRYAGQPIDLPLVRDTELGGVSCRLYSSGLSQRPGVVQIHGGGWVTGDMDSQDVTCRRLAAQSGWAVVAVDFRRSPEHPYPAALDDVMSVTEALRSGAEDAVDPARLAVLGDSAGGNMAAVAARRVRDAGGPPYELQVLIYPVTDAAMDTRSYRKFAADCGLTAAAMRFYWSAYAPPDPFDPDVSPLRTLDLAGLPPAYVITAEFDPLRDEGEGYAAALAEAGVPVAAHRCIGAIHGFWRLPGFFDAGRSAISDVAGALRGVG
ncbi:MAG: alpha/beta hydrolase fold domain-containing protein [Geodermatophilaceae bacterium]